MFSYAFYHLLQILDVTYFKLGKDILMASSEGGLYQRKYISLLKINYNKLQINKPIIINTN